MKALRSSPWKRTIAMHLAASPFRVPLFCLFIVVLLTAGGTRAQADVVLTWNEVLREAVREDVAWEGSTQQGPTFASRNMAMVHGAIFDAVNSIDRSYHAYHISVDAPTGASLEAAASHAAYNVLLNLYPQQQARFDTALQNSLAGLSDPVGLQAGQLVGETVAQAMLQWRADDGAHAPYNYTVSTAPGAWQPDPLHPGQTALSPHWGSVTPFAMGSSAAFMPPPPPPLDSAEYAAAFEQVKLLGAKESELRTDDQTEAGIFWGYDAPGMGPPPILYNKIAKTVALDQGNTLVENARLFALINIAQADAGIASWDAKYEYNLWRPITAIRNADDDGNPLTVADPGWEPLGAPADDPFTPPFPAYTSGHATFGAAMFRSLALFYGTDDISFSIASEELPGVIRSYDSFSQGADENGMSRIYLGIHWMYDNEWGQTIGTEVANVVFAGYMQPVPEPSTLVLAAVGLAALLLRRVRRHDKSDKSVE